jgi:hypothetical protein
MMHSHLYDAYVFSESFQPASYWVSWLLFEVCFWYLLSAPSWWWTSRIEWNDNQTQRLLPLFHSTCPGEFFLRVLIRCLFSHFSVRYSILCTSWRGRRILFRRFFAVFECLIHRYKHNIRIPLFLLKSEPACSQYLWQYRTHTKHENYGDYGIPPKIVPTCQLRAHQGPLKHYASRDGTLEFSPWSALRNNCPSRRMVIRIHGRALRTENWRMLRFFCFKV